MMNIYMTTATYWNDIEPMIGSIRIMVILLGSIGTFATSVFCWFTKFTGLNGISNGKPGLTSVEMSNQICSLTFSVSNFTIFALSVFSQGLLTFIALSPPSMNLFAFFASIITSQSLLTFFALIVSFLTFFIFFSFAIVKCILFLTFFAPILITIFTKRMFIKLRNGFSALAFGASFVYDWFRHGFLLQRKSCLEPVAAQTAIGSLIIANLWGGSQYE